MHDCSVIKCESYEEKAVYSALEEALSSIDGLSFIKKGMLVAIKPNLVSFRAPDAAATTHPALIAALVKMLIERGASVVIGDSPGGPHSLALLNKVYSTTGFSSLEALGARLNRSLEQNEADFPEGRVLKKFKYMAFLSEADAIIDFCKLKAHGMMGMSAAVKNLFGAIPGLLKPELHYAFPAERDFADMLVDLNEFFKPRLTVCDAIIGMEGNGPLSGTPKKIGAVIASKSPYICDLVCAELIGRKYGELLTLQAAHERGLAPKSIENISIYGDISKLKLTDFSAPTVRELAFMKEGSFLHFISSRALAKKPKLRAKLCIGCAECARMCPAKAIKMKESRKEKRPVIDRKACIRCFCCQEFCPKAAMIVHRPAVAKILNRLKL